MNQPTTDFDIIITGGGLVGASLACALGGSSLKIAVIESHTVPVGGKSTELPSPSYDDRAIALSYGSAQIFRSIGLWPTISTAVQAIKNIHVSDKGHFGVTRLDAKDENIDALGYVITAKNLGNLLYQTISQLNNVTLINPATLTDLNTQDACATITIDNREISNGKLTARLVVAADGGNSSIRNLLGVSAQQTDYHQTAVTTNISTDKPHGNTAYERFTAQGPLALLPLRDKDYSLVWTRDSDNINELVDLSDDAFLLELQNQFGFRAGKFIQVGKRSTHPLKLIKVDQQIFPRTVLVGNAAHTLHPIAGQGFNLGMRDVATLAQIIVDNAPDNDIGSLPTLQQYQDWRKRDQRTIIGLTDNLVRVFSTRFPPLAIARNIGMIAMDLLPPVKHLLATHTMGVAGKLPRLARGLPL